MYIKFILRKIFDLIREGYNGLINYLSDLSLCVYVYKYIYIFFLIYHFFFKCLIFILSIDHLCTYVQFDDTIKLFIY